MLRVAGSIVSVLTSNGFSSASVQSTTSVTTLSLSMHGPDELLLLLENGAAFLERLSWGILLVSATNQMQRYTHSGRSHRRSKSTWEWEASSDHIGSCRSMDRSLTETKQKDA